MVGSGIIVYIHVYIIYCDLVFLLLSSPRLKKPSTAREKGLFHHHHVRRMVMRTIPHLIISGSEFPEVDQGIYQRGLCDDART
jgi:hypothetical protein